MTTKLRNIAVGLTLLSALLVAPLGLAPSAAAHHCVSESGVPGPAHSGNNISECLDAGACLETTGASCAKQVDARDKVGSMLRTVLNVLSIAAGVAAVIMIIIGGLKYVMSTGESSNLSSAKNTILYAIIGLIVVAMAQIVVKFVLSKVGT